MASRYVLREPIVWHAEQFRIEQPWPDYVYRDWKTGNPIVIGDHDAVEELEDGDWVVWEEAQGSTLRSGLHVMRDGYFQAEYRPLEDGT